MHHSRHTRNTEVVEPPQPSKEIANTIRYTVDNQGLKSKFIQQKSHIATTRIARSSILHAKKQCLACLKVAFDTPRSSLSRHGT